MTYELTYCRRNKYWDAVMIDPMLVSEKHRIIKDKFDIDKMNMRDFVAGIAEAIGVQMEDLTENLEVSYRNEIWDFETQLSHDCVIIHSKTLQAMWTIKKEV